MSETDSFHSDRSSFLFQWHPPIPLSKMSTNLQRENPSSPKWISSNLEPTVTPWWLRSCPPTPSCTNRDPPLPITSNPLSSPSASSATTPAPSSSPLATNKVLQFHLPILAKLILFYLFQFPFYQNGNFSLGHCFICLNFESLFSFWGFLCAICIVIGFVRLRVFGALVSIMHLGL